MSFFTARIAETVHQREAGCLSTADEGLQTINCRPSTADRRLQTVAQTPKLISEEINLNSGDYTGITHLAPF